MSTKFDTAARRGNLQEIIRLREEGNDEWDGFTMDIVLENGHLACLQYLHQNGCPWGTSRIARAAYNCHFECVKYAYENGCPTLMEDSKYVALGGNLECLKYLLERGFEMNETTSWFAASNDKVECLQHLHENGCPWDMMTTEKAAQNKTLDCLKYALDNGCPYDIAKVLQGLNSLRVRISFDGENLWLREFLFPHVDSEHLNRQVNKDLYCICKDKMDEIYLQTSLAFKEGVKLPREVLSFVLKQYF
jgi:hypothetical protein